MAPGGQMLTMFHSPARAGSGAARAEFSRYHLTDSDAVDVQRAGDYPLLNHYNNRQIEGFLKLFKGYHFFLGKDNLREVVVTR
jgi:hypothetical protein